MDMERCPRFPYFYHDKAFLPPLYQHFILPQHSPFLSVLCEGVQGRKRCKKVIKQEDSWDRRTPPADPRRVSKQTSPSPVPDYRTLRPLFNDFSCFALNENHH